jgi:signal transduction histidine kinase
MTDQITAPPPAAPDTLRVAPRAPVILHLEDSPLDAELARARLQRAIPGCVVRCVCTRAEYEAALRDGGFDVILSDYALPEFDGSQALEIAQRLAPDAPFLFLSGALGEDVAVSTLHRGATDYVLKQRMERLGPAVEKALITAADRAQRRRAEAALRLSEQRLRLAVSTAPLLLLAVDPEMRVTWVGKPHASFPDSAIGRRLDELEDAPKLVELREFLEYVRRTQRPGHATICVGDEGCDGSRSGYGHAPRPPRTVYDVSAEPVRDERGDDAGLIVAAVDVTERVLAEERLDAAVRLARAELEKSHEAQRRSERLASLGTMAAGLGHDIGNLLLPLRVRAQSLRARAADAGALEDLAAIEQTAEYFASLVRGLRMFAREGGDQPGSVTSLAGWREDALPFLRNLVGPHLALDAWIDPALPPVAIGPAALTQTVVNVVKNAADAIGPPPGDVTPADAATVPAPAVRGHIRIRATLQSGGVALSITDDGPGMTADVAARCLEPYFTTKVRGAQTGTGLGLSIVHKAVTSVGGRVRVDSAPGRGTTVTLWLPTPAPVEAPAPGRPALVDVRDPRVAVLAAAVLRQEGFAPARHGEPGVDLAQICVTDEAESPAQPARFGPEAGAHAAPPGAQVLVYERGESGQPAALGDRIVRLKPRPSADELRAAIRTVARTTAKAG